MRAFGSSFSLVEVVVVSAKGEDDKMAVVAMRAYDWLCANGRLSLCVCVKSSLQYDAAFSSTYAFSVWLLLILEP